MNSFRLIALLLVVATTRVVAQQASNNDDLAAKATDPTAALMSFLISDAYTSGFDGVDGSSNQLLLRAAIPFSLAGTQHMFRVTLPVVTSTPTGGSGIADLTVFDLMVFDQPWGRWGVGLVATLPTGGSGLSLDKWVAGPAAGFVNSSNKQYIWGLFVQTFFSYAGDGNAADVGVINLQPIFSYPLGKGRSLSMGNSALVYDTGRSRWSSLAMGINYGQVVGFAGRKWRPNFEVDYDFNKDVGNPQWTFRLGVVLLVPAGK